MDSPAFSFYAKDFMLSTVTMSLAERGAYITLLAYQWDRGTVPSGAVELSRLFGCSASQAKAYWSVLADKFEIGADGMLRNHRLEMERAKQAERREKLAQNGRKGGRPTKAIGNQTETNRFSFVKANENQMKSLPSPSPVQEQIHPLTPADAGADVSRKDITRAERKWAEEAIHAFGGRCPHGEPECGTKIFCIGRLVAEKRAEELRGRKVGAA